MRREKVGTKLISRLIERWHASGPETAGVAVTRMASHATAQVPVRAASYMRIPMLAGDNRLKANQRSTEAVGNLSAVWRLS